MQKLTFKAMLIFVSRNLKALFSSIRFLGAGSKLSLGKLEAKSSKKANLNGVVFSQ